MNQQRLVTWIYNLMQSNNLRRFYKSKLWRKLRSEVLKENNYECQVCKHKGKYSKAYIVHHILHVKDRPELALTKANLMSVCAECHNILHPEKGFSNFHKKNNKQFLNEEKW